MNRHQDNARRIMLEFATRTGLADTGRAERRYLWTDAFAVCNFLGLWLSTGDGKMRELALRLIDEVHHVLGRHRDDDVRNGWISGLTEERGERSPTIGGLRIGKELPERDEDAPFDERLEWNRDGQYFHYLTKWMHALHRAAGATGDTRYDRWAVELASTAQSRFTYRGPGGQLRMYWKMSIDLGWPQVPSMGHHDPLDGFLTFAELRAAPSSVDALAAETAAMAEMCRGREWVTDDPLGLGGLLFDALRLARIRAFGPAPAGGPDLEELLRAALYGLQFYIRGNPFTFPAETRLGFRELGLAIGLRALPRIRALLERHPDELGTPGVRSTMAQLAELEPLGSGIERFWLAPSQRRSVNWQNHLDINEVMLATSLAPAGFLSTDGPAAVESFEIRKSS